MLLYNLVDVQELEGLNFMIDIKPGWKFVYFAYDEEGLGKQYTMIETAERDGKGWTTLIQTFKDSPHLADIDIPDYKIIERIFE